MGTDDRQREWVWYVNSDGDNLPATLPAKEAQKVESRGGSTVWTVRATRAVIDQRLPKLLNSQEVNGATCVDSSGQPRSGWETSGALVVNLPLAQRIWKAADILGGPWSAVEHKYSASGFYEDPVTMYWDHSNLDNVKLQLKPRKVYGSKAWNCWQKAYEQRQAAHKVQEEARERGDGPLLAALGESIRDAQKRMNDLREEKEAPGSFEEDGRQIEVASYSELVDRVAFLGVMNKTLNLLFRGQTKDLPVLATIYRREFTVRRENDELTTMCPDMDPGHYYDQLEAMRKSVVDVLDRWGLPRKRHMNRPAAAWAVIQHYELWPTPLVDFTTSLRVAATFAFGFDSRTKEFNRTSERGYLWVYGVPGLTGDLMQPTSSGLAVRLNSVCPPSARRPHLQDGVLVGREDRALVVEDHTVAAIPIAKIHLDNRDSSFWHDSDFPPLSQGSLLPAKDDLRQQLLQSLNYERDNSSRWTVQPRAAG